MKIVLFTSVLLFCIFPKALCQAKIKCLSCGKVFNTEAEWQAHRHSGTNSTSSNTTPRILSHKTKAERQADKENEASRKLAHRHSKANKFNDEGVNLMKQGKYGSAVKYYQKARKLWPQDQTILNNLKRAVSLIPDDAIDKDKVTDKSWVKHLGGRFKFRDWADIWKDKEDKGALARQNESGKLSSEAFKLAANNNFRQAYQTLNEALEIDPDNSSVIKENIQKIKSIEVKSLNEEMRVLSNSDYEATLLKARDAFLVDPDNPLTKETLNNIDVQELIKEANEAEGMEASDLALEKYKKALEKDPDNQEIQKRIKAVELEINRIKNAQTAKIKGDGDATKALTEMAKDKDIAAMGFDKQKVSGGAIPANKIQKLENDPAYKKVISESKIIQENYKTISSKIEKNHAKMKDPATKPEELEELVKETQAMKIEMENAKKSFEEKKKEKEEIKKSFHETPIEN